MGQDGVVTYSTQHTRICGPTDRPGDVNDALTGQSIGRVNDIEVGVDASRAEREVFVSLLPHGFSNATEAGVFVMYHDYEPVAGAVQGAFLPIAGVFEIVIVGLTLGLVPALRRLTRQIPAQMEEIERRAYFDPLTSLPNRALLEDRLGQALARGRREGTQTGVLLMDINGFKDVNDTLGRSSGDELLARVAERLEQALRETDSLPRLSGDEFAVIVPNASQKTLVAVSEQVDRALERPFPLADVPLDVSVGAGAALAPEHGDSVQLLLQHAEVAMYHAEQARVSLVLYKPENDTSDADRLALLAELRQAIEENQFVLHYQPKAEMKTYVMRGVKVLVR